MQVLNKNNTQFLFNKKRYLSKKATEDKSMNFFKISLQQTAEGQALYQKCEKAQNLKGGSNIKKFTNQHP